MIDINYKRLFELRILHDYFLSGEGGESFFALNQADREARLAVLGLAGQYNSWNSLILEPHADTLTLMRSHRMRMLKEAMGIVVAARVNVHKENGDTLYEPFVPLADEDELVFNIRIADPLFTNFTNLPWRQGHFPAVYLFSNEHARNTDDSKVLARPVASLAAGSDYVMGDLVTQGGNIREIYFPLDSDVQDLLPVEGDGFVNPSDRTLLPKSLYFDFLSPTTDEATFTLRQTGGELVKEIVQPAGGLYRFVKLDFSRTDDDPPVLIPDGDYLLEVTTDGGFDETYEMTFSDQLYDKRILGVVRFRVRTGDVDFDLLDPAGRLHTRILADETKVRHPVFELRFLNRRTYWRYQQRGGFDANEHGDYLELTGDKLVSKMPRPLTGSLTYFEPGAYLPNAKPSSLKFEEKKIFSEIYISPVNRLTV